MRTFVLVVLAAGLVAACASAPHPKKPTGGASRIRLHVYIEGAVEVDPADVIAGLALTRVSASGQTYDPHLVAIDEQRVRGYYLRRAYFHVEVTSSISERPGAVDVVFRVTEGKRARLARVEIEGLPPDVPAQEIRDLIHLADGAFFDFGPYEKAKSGLLTPLERASYARARVTATVVADLVRDEATIRLVYEPGPLCKFGKIELRGVSGSLAKAVRGRIRVHEGQPYSAKALDRTQELLYEMGRFAEVRVEPGGSEGDAIVPITINLVPSEPSELRLGGGVGIDPESTEVHGRAGYGITGWPRPLLTSRVELKPALIFRRDERELRPQLEVLTSLERIDLFQPRMRGVVELSVAYLQIEAYTSAGPSFRLGASSPVGERGVQASFGWQIRALDFRDLDPAIDAETATRLGLDVELYQLGFFEQSVVLDLRDDPVRPTHGLYSEIRLEEGTPAAGGDFTYLRLTPELRGYHAPRPHTVLAARARFGTFVGDVPMTQRYYGGGASGQRGFAERRLSPVASQVVDEDLETVVIGGSTLVEINIEARMTVGMMYGVPVGGVFFLDGGDVTEEYDEIDLTFLHWAAGAGVRVATPVGPARFDVGYRFTRTGPGEPEPGRDFAFHLSLGEAF